MKKANRTLFILLALFIAIPSIIHYAIFNSWISIIGFGISVLIFLILNITQKVKKQKSKFIFFLNILIWIMLIINFGVAFYNLFLKNFKVFTLLIEISILVFSSMWRETYGK